MKVKVELVYPSPKENVTTTVEVRDGITGQRLLKAIGKQVELKFKDDKEWTGWNIIDIEE
jgi:hypothetical protein